VLNIFTQLHNKSSELFHAAKLKSYTHYTIALFHLPQPLTVTNLFSVSVSLTTLGTSFKWNPTVFPFCDQLLRPAIMSSRFIHWLSSFLLVFFFFFFQQHWLFLWGEGFSLSATCGDLSRIVCRVVGLLLQSTRSRARRLSGCGMWA